MLIECSRASGASRVRVLAPATLNCRGVVVAVSENRRQAAIARGLASTTWLWPIWRHRRCPLRSPDAPALQYGRLHPVAEGMGAVPPASTSVVLGSDAPQAVEEGRPGTAPTETTRRGKGGRRSGDHPHLQSSAYGGREPRRDTGMVGFLPGAIEGVRRLTDLARL